MTHTLPRMQPAARKRNRHRRTASAWVRARKIVQYLALAAFVGLFIVAGQQGSSGSLLNVPMRLDPLLVLTHLLASRTWLAGSSLAILTIVLTLIFGRAWCGWLCPLGTTLDLLQVDKLRGKHPLPPDSWRRVKYALLMITIVAAFLGNLTLLFFDPLAILTRTLTVSVWPAANVLVTSAEGVLFRAPGLDAAISVVDAWLRPAILPAQPLYYRNTIGFALFIVGLIGLDLIATRFWCRYLCPLGALLGLCSKVAPFRRRLTQECKGCTLCTDVCPTGTINPSKGYESDPGECTMCLDCLDACPRSLTTFRPELVPAKWNEYDPTRRDSLLAAGAAIVLVGVLRSDPFARREAPALLRPPGFQRFSDDAASPDLCTRCGECLRVCPTGGLQPAVMDAGLAGLGSPILIPRLGYCDYSCTACGQACPVQAIQPLSLEQKRLEVIGKAYIDEDRCIAWADHTPCIVCEEMCPLPDKAIQLELPETAAGSGTDEGLQLPHVVPDLCIGCGICEYKCPVAGGSAIRVFNTQNAGAL